MSTSTKAAPTGHLQQTIAGIIDFADEHAGHAHTQQLLQGIALECIRRSDRATLREIHALALAGLALSAAATAVTEQSKP